MYRYMHEYLQKCILCKTIKNNSWNDNTDTRFTMMVQTVTYEIFWNRSEIQNKYSKRSIAWFTIFSLDFALISEMPAVL